MFLKSPYVKEKDKDVIYIADNYKMTKYILYCKRTSIWDPAMTSRVPVPKGLVKGYNVSISLSQTEFGELQFSGSPYLQ
jgi:hypothetical protein